MDFYEGVQARLLDSGAVQSLVSDQIFWTDRPRNSPLPAIVLTVPSNPQTRHLKGPDAGRWTRVQCDCWGRSTMEAIAIANAAIAALREPETVGGKRFGQAQVQGPIDLSEAANAGDERSLRHRQSVDFIIWHRGE